MLIAVSSLSAQHRDGKPEDSRYKESSRKKGHDAEFRVGMSFGGNVNFMKSALTEHVSDGSLLYPAIGIYADVPLVGNVYASLGLRYNEKGGKLSYLQTTLTNDAYIRVGQDITSTYSLRMLDIPILIKLFTNDFGHWTFNGAAGVTPAFRLGANVENAYTNFSYENNTNKVTGTLLEKNVATKDVNFFDISATLQVTFLYRLAARTALTMGLNGDIGLLDNLKNLGATTGTDVVVKTHQIGLSIGLIF
ncbi:hypothetical protein FACS1894201_00500 [Bacteroidia bacterium]|nr:hypothetical protein FACS1894201_00500 [Bacteroidia bacterium]